MLIKISIEALLGTVLYPLAALTGYIRTFFVYNVLSTRWTARRIRFTFSMMRFCPMSLLALAPAVCWDFASNTSFLHCTVDHYT